MSPAASCAGLLALTPFYCFAFVALAQVDQKSAPIHCVADLVIGAYCPLGCLLF
jgi:hypothetical protein